MKIFDTKSYPTRYKTAEARALYLTAVKGYRSIGNMAKDIGVVRTYTPQCFKLGLPEKYAGYLGRKWGFSPGLLAYEDYLTLATVRADTMLALEYEQLLKNTKFFTAEECAYILKGSYIKDAQKWIRQADKLINKRAA